MTDPINDFLDEWLSMKGLIAAVILAALAIVVGMVGCPSYAVYQQRKHGEAELARAQSNRMIAVQEAEAKLEAAAKLAAADTIRANGIAASNRIIGNSLNQNPKYLTWLLYETLKDTKNQVIYLPTEATIPITESHRLRKDSLP